MNELSKQKEQLRQSSREKRNSFREEYIEESSRLACEHLTHSKEYISAKTILIYYPTRNEISPLPIMNLAIRDGKQIAFPVCDKVKRTLTFKKVSSISELEPASFGIFEPKSFCKQIEIDEHTLCIVPALLFSRDGHRLGYGMGYYDRFLNNFTGKSIGFSYSALLCDSLPHEEHDIPLDMIITESEVLYIA